MACVINATLLSCPHEFSQIPQMTPDQCRMARTALHWSMKQLASAADLSERTVLKFEKGEHVSHITIETLRQVLVAKGIKLVENGVIASSHEQVPA